MAKDEGKGKEVKLLLEAKGSEATLKANNAILKAKEANPKVINLPVSQRGSKVDPSPTKAQS